MTQTIVYAPHSATIQRVVRSQRTFRGLHVGAIRDRGWLIMVKRENGVWTPWHTIRKVK